MKNFVQPGNTITVPAPTAVASGDGVLVGSLFGVANYDAAPGEAVEIDAIGVFDLPKAEEAIDLGDASIGTTPTATSRQSLKEIPLLVPQSRMPPRRTRWCA
ncbi:hypothetical protein A7A08_01849 [Methyloligella halotolerans]|uniref:DUF2190 family protein n=1 Tax=Methyloligella halotolerans TaxID=1177755 RepID=A0A1E2RXZ9_9HYPH|nr:hypothetical protein A7A08_01849 [Methyloligella halotolerans]